jgi:hypothetical protein
MTYPANASAAEQYVLSLADRLFADAASAENPFFGANELPWISQTLAALDR